MNKWVQDLEQHSDCIPQPFQNESCGTECGTRAPLHSSDLSSRTNVLSRVSSSPSLAARTSLSPVAPRLPLQINQLRTKQETLGDSSPLRWDAALLGNWVPISQSGHIRDNPPTQHRGREDSKSWLYRRKTSQHAQRTVTCKWIKRHLHHINKTFILTATNVTLWRAFSCSEFKSPSSAIKLFTESNPVITFYWNII